MEANLEGNSFIVSAYDHDKVMECHLLIWDGGIDALLQDVIVVPEYQMKGIESEMITRIFNFLRTKLKPDYGIQVDTKAWLNKNNSM